MRHPKPPEESEFRVRRRLERAAEAIAGNPFYVASALAQYRRVHGLDAAQLAQWLHCPTSLYPKLALCRRPDPATARYQTEIDAIAAAVTCDRDRLAAVLAEAER